MKKVEIVIEESVLDKVVDLLNDNDLLAQTELTESRLNSNSENNKKFPASKSLRSLSIICSNSQKDKIAARLFPLINMFGGFCASYDLLY